MKYFLPRSLKRNSARTNVDTEQLIDWDTIAKLVPWLDVETSIIQECTRQISGPNANDWETLDDDETIMKCYAWEILMNALHGNDVTSAIDILTTTFSRELFTDCILHEAIELGVPDHTLMQLAERFPIMLYQIDGNGRYPLHVSCALGASAEFVELCINKNPSAITAKDIDGRTPLHLLCQNTWEDYWDVKYNHEAEPNMRNILWMLHNKAPSVIVFKDNKGVGPLEYAIESNLSITFVKQLQIMIVKFNKEKARKLSRNRCTEARRKLMKQSTH